MTHPPTDPRDRSERLLDVAWQAATMGALALGPLAAAWDLARGRGLGPVAERLGLSPRPERASPPVTWIAASSAGEVAVALPLLEALASTATVLSVGTAHGRRAASRHRSLLAAPPFHPPLDARPCVATALSRLRPRALVAVETEIWPNLYRACARRGIPVAIVNARLSERSFPRYLRVRPLIASALRGVAVVCARTEDDARRYREIGAAADRVVVTGNLKFDAASLAAREPDLSWARAAGLTVGPWLAFGSTAEGEEAALLDAFEAVRGRHPDLRLVVAPKRPERWDEAAAMAARRGLAVVRRSAFGDAGPAREVPPGGVLVLDTTGELARVYRHARVAFVGGSLVPHGGQNLLEPAACGVPVLFGPHVANFRDAADALLAGGGGVASDRAHLRADLERLLGDERLRERAAQAARRTVEAHAGALRRTLDLLSPHLHPG